MRSARNWGGEKSGMSNEIIIVDTEYTTWEGARESGWSKPDQHREIVQIAAIRFDLDSGNETAAFDVLVKPEFNATLSQLFTNLTSITQEQIDARGISYPDALHEFLAFCGDTPILCYNADEDVFRENCALHDITISFTAPWKKLRPALRDVGVNPDENSSGTLHKLTDRPLNGHVHYALHDVRSMGSFIDFQIRQGKTNFVETLPVKPETLVALDLQKARNARERLLT